MKTKYNYQRPSIEIIHVEAEETIMTGSGFGAGSQEDPGLNRSKERKSFWDNE